MENLTKSEIEFLKHGRRWNKHFEMMFMLLLIMTVIVPFILLMKSNVPHAEKIFKTFKYYDFFLALGLLVTFINARWLQIIKKLTQT